MNIYSLFVRIKPCATGSGEHFSAIMSNSYILYYIQNRGDCHGHMLKTVHLHTPSHESYIYTYVPIEIQLSHDLILKV